MSQTRTSIYREYLRSPAWASRRYQIIQRADHRCEECGAQESETTRLEVHHRHYRPGAMPWEYDNRDLVCLCRSCHEIITDQIDRARQLIGRLPITAFPALIKSLDGLLAQPWPKVLPASTTDGSEEEL